MGRVLAAIKQLVLAGDLDVQGLLMTIKMMLMIMMRLMMLAGDHDIQALFNKLKQT